MAKKPRISIGEGSRQFLEELALQYGMPASSKSPVENMGQALEMLALTKGGDVLALVAQDNGIRSESHLPPSRGVGPAQDYGSPSDDIGDMFNCS